MFWKEENCFWVGMFDLNERVFLMGVMVIKREIFIRVLGKKEGGELDENGGGIV